MAAPASVKYKISLIGDGEVGKTSLVTRYIKNEFDEKYMQTLGTNVYTKEIFLPAEPNQVRATLQVWDVMGQRVFKSIIKSALDNANGVILVCDLSNKETLMNLLYWIKIIYNNTRNVSFVFLGNKDDMNEPAFGLPALFSLSASFGSKAFLTSAKTGNNVEKAFYMIANDILNKRFIPPKGKFDFDLEDVIINPLVQTEDKLINTFCLSLGGLESGMPIAQQIFNDLDLDFLSPTKEELEAVSEAFLYYLLEYTPDKAEEMKAEFKKILGGIP